MSTALPVHIAVSLSPDQIILLRWADDFGPRLSRGEVRELCARGLAVREFDGIRMSNVLTEAGREILRGARLAVKAVAR